MRVRTFAAFGAVAAVAVGAAGPAQADPAPTWDGWYRVTFHTDQKSGTSIAAKQAEEAYSAWYRFGTDCSAGPCQASVIDGPNPKDNVSSSTKFDWNGNQWSHTTSWRWDCLLSDGTITYDAASSVTTYTPQPDGSITGTFATNIGGGACSGTVYIPITAVPGNPPAA